MKKNRVEEVFKKMVFLQDDININFINIVIAHNVKSSIDYQIERDLIYSQLEMIVKCLNSSNDEIKKSAKSLGMRIVAGVLIFLAPSVILWVFGLISDFSEAKDAIDFPTCQTCLLTPYKC